MFIWVTLHAEATQGLVKSQRCSRNSIISWPAYKSLPNDPCKHNWKYSLEDLGIQLLDLKPNNQLNKVFYYLLWSSNLDFDRWYYSQDFSFSIPKSQSYCFKYPKSGEIHIMLSVSIFEPCCNYTGLNVLFRQSNIFVKEILPDFLIVSDTGLLIEGFTVPKKILKSLYSQADGKNKQNRYQAKYLRHQT